MFLEPGKPELGVYYLTFAQFSILATNSKFKNTKHFKGQTKHVYSFCLKVLPLEWFNFNRLISLFCSILFTFPGTRFWLTHLKSFSTSAFSAIIGKQSLTMGPGPGNDRFNEHSESFRETNYHTSLYWALRPILSTWCLLSRFTIT